MTRQTNARIAGAAYLLYIVFALSEMFVLDGATRGDTPIARVANAAQHLAAVRFSLILSIPTAGCAIALAVSLYGITREVDREISLLGYGCRMAEGFLNGIPITVGAFLWLTAAHGTNAPDAATTTALLTIAGRLSSWRTFAGSWFFSIGSSAFAYLLLRGRMIPPALAWIGVVASILLVVCLPLGFGGLLQGPAANVIWIPMIFFEVPLGFYFLVKGARTP